MAAFSARSDFRNLSRAGVAANSSVTSIRVPRCAAAGRTGPFRPASMVRLAPASASGVRLTMASRDTAPIDGKASPRKPSVSIAVRSPPGSFEVA